MYRSTSIASLGLVILATGSAQASPRTQSGMLTAPSTDAAADIASRYVHTTPALSAGLPTKAVRVQTTRQLGLGSLVELQQQHDGLPVIGARAAVRIDDSGRVRWASSSLRSLAGLATEPSLTMAQAARLAAGKHVAAPRGRLVISALGSEPARLAWEITNPPNMAALEMWRVLIDAHDGRVLARRNLIQRAEAHTAHVFEENPVATPDVSTVTLADLPEEATTLVGPVVGAANCVDEGQCVDAGFGGYYHWCSISPMAETNVDGNFEDHVAPDNMLQGGTFAEIQVYYHTVKAYQAFRAIMGDDEFAIDGTPVTAIANLQFPGDSCGGPGPAPGGSSLMPLDNAFFVPADSGFVPGVEGAAIAMGQGSMVNFSYDGDVIYHELGHGLVYTLNPDLGYALPHEHGYDPTPAGLAEGLPDYFSSVITGDALLGEWAGSGFALEDDVIRNLDNQRSCPESVAGESHADGEIIGGALWQLRETLDAGDRAVLDSAVATVVDAMGANGGFDALQSALVAEIEVVLGADAATSAEAIFVERGLDGCGEFIRDMTTTDVHERLFMLEFVGELAPGPVQFRIDTGAGVDSITMAATVYPGASTEPIVALIKSGAPIQWSGGSHDADAIVNIAPSGGTIAGPFQGEVYVQLASTSGYHAINELSFGGFADAEPDAGPVGPDAGGPGADGDDSGGCGCRTSGTGGPAGAALVVGAVLLGWRRRRV